MPAALCRSLALAVLFCLPSVASQAQDAAAGEKVFKKCLSCHSLSAGENKIGPSLFGVVDRPVASVDGFKYSEAMRARGGTWTPQELDAYLANPRQAVPGTSMSFMGLKKPEDRAALIDYLRSHK